MKYSKIASYAVYSELYDKKIVNKPIDIIVLCIKNMLKNNIIQISFDSVMVSKALEDNYSFDDVPLLVIDRALSILVNEGDIKKISNTNSYYSEIIAENDDLNYFFEKEQECIHGLLDELKDYSDKKFGVKYTINDIEKALSNILLSDKVDVVDNLEKSLLAYLNRKQNNDFDKILKSLRVGHLLYSGLSVDLLVENRITNELYLFFDQEILFYLMGYDSDITKKWVEDLVDLIKKIDSEKKIKLKYFDRTKIEIENYFTEARLIKEKHKLVDYSKRPMVKIINDTKDGKGVSELQGEFFGLLEKKFGICLYNDKWIDSQDAYKYNIIDENFNSDDYFEDSDRNNIASFINTVNAIRNGNNNTELLESKAIFITNTLKYSKVSKNICCSYGNSRHIYMLNNFTNILWNICNHKFTKCDIPSNINAIKYLNQTFKNVIGQDLSKVFEEAKRDFKNNKIDENILKQKLYAVNEYQKKVQRDELTDSEIEELLSIDAELIASKGEELSLANLNYQKEVSRHNETRKENSKLRDENKQLLNEIQNNELENEKIKKELRLEIEKNKKLEDEKIGNRLKRIFKYIYSFFKSHKKLVIVMLLLVVLIILILCGCIDVKTIIGLIYTIVSSL